MLHSACCQGLAENTCFFLVEAVVGDNESHVDHASASNHSADALVGLYGDVEGGVSAFFVGREAKKK